MNVGNNERIMNLIYFVIIFASQYFSYKSEFPNKISNFTFSYRMISL